MKYKVFNENNYSERMNGYFATYFKTKAEAVAYAKEIGNATIMRKCGCTWVEC